MTTEPLPDLADRGRPLAVHHGRIHTGHPARPVVPALLAHAGRIAAAGSDDEVLAMAGAYPGCEQLDLGGACVVPGFVDSHIHLMAYGLTLERVDLAAARSLDAVRTQVAVAVRQAEAAPGQWVTGWGWDHSLWEHSHFPDRSSLDSVSTTVPIALRRKDGHLLWVNSAALRAAGIARDTPDPPCGRIGRDAAGEPNGLLFESAINLVDRVVPEISPEQAERAIGRAIAALHRLGVTGAHVPEGALTFRALQALDARRALTLRTTIMLAYDTLDASLATGIRTGFGSEWLRVGPVKVFLDGSLGSETAAMLDPFEGSDNRGMLLLSEDDVAGVIRRAADGGIASAVHAIGDRANRTVLNAFERTRHVWQPMGLRQRIEHVQVLHPDDVPRLASLGIVASMQPIHATQDMVLVDRHWGPRGRYAYAFRSLLASGAVLAFGSDAPVESPDPLAGLFAAVARRRPGEPPAACWYPEERLSIGEALRAYTAGAAYAAGVETSSAQLSPGRWADFVALSNDIITAPPERLLEIEVRLTVAGGEVVHRG